MGKKSKRDTQRNEEDQSSCMSGLIGIFDFRQGRSTQKLLSDGKYGSGHASSGGDLKSRHNLPTSLDEIAHNSDDGDKGKIQKVDGAKMSVKKLIEEEMSNEQQPKHQIGNVAVEETQSDLKNGSGKNHLQVRDSKASASLRYQQPHDLPNSEEQSSNKINLVAVMEELSNQFKDTQEAHLQHENVGKFSDVQESTSSVKHTHLDKANMQIQSPNIPEKMSEATEAFLNQKIIEAEQQSRGHQSKLFMDALEMLNSNKELFLKLLQDPNSLLVKHIEDLRDAQALALAKVSPEEKMSNSRECEKLVSEKKLKKQSVHAFFRRKSKSQNIKPSKGNDNPQAFNNIVLLKSGPEGKQNSGTKTSPSLRTEEPRVRNTSQFSFTEIGKKLKHVMGERRKEQRWPAIFHRIPYKQPESEASKEINKEVTDRGSPRESNIHIGRITDHSINVKGRGKVSQSKDLEPSELKDHEPIIGHEDAPTSVDGQNITLKTVENFKESESNIYIEAVKHLSDMVSTGKEDIDLSCVQIPKTLGRILSVPEYNVSPIFSPGRDKEHGSVTAEMRVQPHDNVQMISENEWQLKEDNGSGILIPLRLNIEIPPCNIDNEADRELQVTDSYSSILQKLSPDRKIKESTCSAKEFSPEADINTVELTNFEHPEEYIPLAVCPEPVCVTALDTTNQGTDATKNFEEEETFEYLGLDSTEQNQSSPSASGPSSPSSVIIQKVVDQEGITDKPEHPSPVSVLEPFILEDATSPGSTTSWPAEPPIQPLQIHLGEYDSSALVSASPDPEIYVSCMEDKNSAFDYVRTVLRISGFIIWDEFLGRSQYTDQILDPSMFDEVEVLSDQRCSDQKQLFDCINEVLVEVYDRYFACSPWVSFGKPNIRPVPLEENLIHEVWEGIECDLLPQNKPLALGQILEKDMEAGKWMDLRFDFELVSNEIGDIILEELTEETIYDLCT